LEAGVKRHTHQRGVVLVIVLVAMLAMMISVIALSRSMDTHQVVAGNLAFRNSGVHSSDAGVQGAVAWLQATVGTPTLNTTAPENGYFAAAGEPDWDNEDFWNGCAACTVGPEDAAGNRVQWVIHRMCSAEGNPNAALNFCSLFGPGPAAAQGGSYAADAVNFPGSGQNYYRITVRVSGPRNTSTLVQAFVSL
jgi:Tfp pilus assembly protein PilX